MDAHSSRPLSKLVDEGVSHVVISWLIKDSPLTISQSHRLRVLEATLSVIFPRESVSVVSRILYGKVSKVSSLNLLEVTINDQVTLSDCVVFGKLADHATDSSMPV